MRNPHSEFNAKIDAPIDASSDDGVENESKAVPEQQIEDSEIRGRV